MLRRIVSDPGPVSGQARKGLRPAPSPVPPILHAPRAPRLDVADGLRQGLDQAQATIAPKFFYDDLGSRLFTAITALPEYYPPRLERWILQQHLADLIAASPVHGCTWVDLGAGDCQKSAALFAAVRPGSYVAVDIAGDFLARALSSLQRQHPGLPLYGVVADFAAELVLPRGVPEARRVFFYPGSSIGNFDPDAATTFLRGVRRQMDDGGALWIGVDLHKATDVLERAYDDALGVTAAFNRNVLLHVNRLAGTDFDIAQWAHVARYDEDLRRIEMYLQAVADLTVTWPGGSRRFAAGERIHTENSYKYTLDGFASVLQRAGLRVAGSWTDPDRHYAFFVAAP
ncbi:MAG: L-histidine N(alpha)-methyltransferase [Planctomycetes bacterium]|nr:L-histidine N(alpha)-methyltransferase [Planctomycetota bacterium]MCB9884060.1 L-histidine N(alpha)-methyltransferase [Planctomycetota bacterium]